MWRTCTKEDCNKQFKQGGTRMTRWCPDCKVEKKKGNHARWDKLRKEEGQATVSSRTWDKWGRVSSSTLHEQLKECGFCKEEFSPRHINLRYCNPCQSRGEDTVAHRNDRVGGISLVTHKSCNACGEMFWKLKGNTTTSWCSDSCKEMLRMHHNCLFCGETISPNQKITSRLCTSKKCTSSYKTIEHLRDDRDGKLQGTLHTPQSRFNVAKRLNACQEILDEFNPTKGVS